MKWPVAGEALKALRCFGVIPVDSEERQTSLHKELPQMHNYTTTSTITSTPIILYTNNTIPLYYTYILYTSKLLPPTQYHHRQYCHRPNSHYHRHYCCHSVTTSTATITTTPRSTFYIILYLCWMCLYYMFYI